MRGYELCLICQADASDETIDGILSTLTSTIEKHQGSVLKAERWGKKNFKYQIKKQSKGHYVFLYFIGNNDVLKDIDRVVRYNETVIRYNTLKLDKNFKVEASEEPVQTAQESPAAETPAVEETSKAADASPGDSPVSDVTETVE